MKRLELPDADADAIKRAIGRMEEMLRAGDFDGWALHWDEDGVVMPPGRPRVVGREAIKAYARDLFRGLVEMRFSQWEVFGQDRLAVVRKNVAARMRDDADETRTLRAKEVVVLVKDDEGQWLVQTIISNSDEAA